MQELNYVLSKDQNSMQVARVLFKQALAISMSNYRVGTAETVLQSPRHQMYSILLSRKQSMSLEAFVTTTGMREATEWISTNAPVRDFFKLLATNFMFLWYETNSAYDNFCRQLAISLTVDPPDAETTKVQIAPLPEEVTGRMLPFADLHSQLSATKHLLAYTLFLLWADIDELSRSDETYNAIASQRPIRTRARRIDPQETV